jgi:hypothetical protein
MKRVHVVGCPRSGTTLMMELLATCFDSDGFCEHEMSIFTPPPGNPQLFFSKKPSDIRYLEKILVRDPNLFAICLQRDPRAVITSIHKSKPGMYFCNYKVWRECQLAAEELIGLQNEILRVFPFLKKRHDFSAYAAVAQPSPESSNALGGVRPITTERQRAWEAHLPRVKEQLQRHPELAEDLIRLGYEPDSSWLARLDQVQAKEFPCRYPERRFDFKRIETRLRKYFQSRAYLARYDLG